MIHKILFVYFELEYSLLVILGHLLLFNYEKVCTSCILLHPAKMPYLIVHQAYLSLPLHLHHLLHWFKELGHLQFAMYFSCWFQIVFQYHFLASPHFDQVWTFPFLRQRNYLQKVDYCPQFQEYLSIKVSFLLLSDLGLFLLI